jgi:hypothetical protein
MCLDIPFSWNEVFIELPKATGKMHVLHSELFQ